MKSVAVLNIVTATVLGVGFGAASGYFSTKNRPSASAGPILTKMPENPVDVPKVNGDPNGPQPKITGVKDYDFGDVLPPFIGSAKWILGNSGTEPLTIMTKDISCGCTSPVLPKGKSVTIDPGKTFEYVASIRIAGNAKAIIRRIITLRTNDPTAEEVELGLIASPKVAATDASAK